MQASQRYTSKSDYLFILFFVIIKLVLNLFAAPHFGYHRDELLHLALGDHLDWGFKEVPPLIGVLAKLSTALLGNTVTAARIFPTIAAGLIVWLTGLLVIEFGGRHFAIALACLSLIFSPAFAASDYLFQPVVFDQLWWVLSAWLTVKYVNSRQVKYLYYLGLVVGLGMLTKYSMAFFAVALLVGVVVTPERKLLLNRATILTIGIAGLVFMPNAIWQYQHHWPVITHMHKLKEQQLAFVKPADFIAQQFLVHCLLWVTALIALLLYRPFRAYRFIGVAYLLVFGFLLLMGGKPYYMFGAYPMLFAVGSCALEILFKQRRYVLRTALILFFTLPNLLLLPIVLPVLSVQQTLGFFRYIQRQWHFMDFATTWEDLKQHPITQDYADMFGWEEMTRKTAAAYHKLTPGEQRHTIIFTDNYGEAGAIHLYRQKYQLPDVISLNSSFALWAPSELNAENMIYISDDDDVSDLVPLSAQIIKVGVVEDKLARERGTGIYLIKGIKPGLKVEYYKHWQAEMSQ